MEKKELSRKKMSKMPFRFGLNRKANNTHGQINAPLLKWLEVEQ